MSHMLGDEEIAVRIPAGLGQIITPSGDLLDASWAVLVPSKTGVRSAYPVLESHRLVKKAIE